MKGSLVEALLVAMILILCIVLTIIITSLSSICHVGEKLPTPYVLDRLDHSLNQS